MSNILKNLIEINTINDKENEKIRTYIKSILKDKKFDFQEIGENKEKRVSFPLLICHSV